MGIYIHDIKYLHNAKSLSSSPKPYYVRTADNTSHIATHIGSIKIKGNNATLVFSPAYLIPTFHYNLISTNAIIAKSQLAIYTAPTNLTYIINNPSDSSKITNQQITIQQADILAVTQPNKSSQLHTFQLIPADSSVSTFDNSRVESIESLTVDPRRLISNYNKLINNSYS